MAPLSDLQPRLRPHLRAGLPALVAVALMLVWAIQNGGFDASTWYWGALLLLATFAAVFAGVFRGHLRLSRTSAIAIGLFAGYVAWSYLSMTWAQYPGIALDGSNRALLYLLIFTLLTALPWTKETAVGALLLFAGGVGVVGMVLMVRLASGANVTVLFFGGRLVAPTGYINSTAALFTIDALVCIVLASWRRLAGPVRGLLVAFAAVSLQLATIVQSRGWLFTLPLIALVAIVIVPDRLRVAAAAVIPVIAALDPGAAAPARLPERAIGPTARAVHPRRPPCTGHVRRRLRDRHPRGLGRRCIAGPAWGGAAPGRGHRARDHRSGGRARPEGWR